MSLRDSYFNGSSGLQQQLDNAFQAGIAFVGAGVDDISTVDLNDRNGSNLGAGAGQHGLYFLYSSPSVQYAVWYQVTSEIAPVIANASLVQVNILSGDSAVQVATKTAAAINALAGTPIDAAGVADVISLESNVAGVALQVVSAGTLGGTAVAAQVQVGVNPTGSYATIQTNLVNAAAQGATKFCIIVQGTGSMNAGYLRQCNGNNLLLKSFFAGIEYAMAGEEIYDYQLNCQLDVTDTVNTNVNLNFNFSGENDKSSKCGCSNSMIYDKIPMIAPANQYANSNCINGQTPSLRLNCK